MTDNDFRFFIISDYFFEYPRSNGGFSLSAFRDFTCPMYPTFVEHVYYMRLYLIIQDSTKALSFCSYYNIDIPKLPMLSQPSSNTFALSHLYVKLLGGECSALLLQTHGFHEHLNPAISLRTL